MWSPQRKYKGDMQDLYGASELINDGMLVTLMTADKSEKNQEINCIDLHHFEGRLLSLNKTWSNPYLFEY